jgi:PhnB protein
MTLRLNPYIILDGQTKEAIAFYEEALGAKTVMVQTFGDMPANPEFAIPEAAKDRVAHATLKVGETDFMMNDTFPGQPLHKGDHVTICVTTNDAATSRNLFDSLAVGGEVQMPFQATFWTAGYGIVKDKFGVTFQITTESKQG